MVASSDVNKLGSLGVSTRTTGQTSAWGRSFHYNRLPSWQWEEQHRGRSCEDFQNWKRTNDPEYQAQGLAMYLQENGIGKATRHSLCSQSDRQ